MAAPWKRSRTATNLQRVYFRYHDGNEPKIYSSAALKSDF